MKINGLKLWAFFFLPFTTSVFATPVKTDVLTWPRSRLPEFGCFMEKQFAYKPKKFNCTLKKYENKGDPCNDTKSYYEGFEFPEKLVTQVNPLIRSIALTWEHGDLQKVSVAFKKKLKTEDIQKEFKLSKSGTNVRENVQQYSIQDCHKDYNCLILVGFDHIGAGDVECGS